jgi:VanZ family protein
VSLVIRKLAHFGEFLILGVLWVLTLTSYSFRLQKAMQLTISIGLLTALSDEFIQTFVPGRAGTLLDVLIDLVGVLVGVFIITGIIKQIEHKKTSP